MNQLNRLGIVFAALVVAFVSYNKSKAPRTIQVDASSQISDRSPAANLFPTSKAGKPEPLNSSSPKGTPSPQKLPRTSNQEIHYPILKIIVPAVQAGKPQTEFLFNVVENEKPVLLSELLYFLDRSLKNDRPYILDEYDCKHFAYQLHQDATKKGMAARFVAMTIRDSPIGHAFNAFLTSDAGVVFVDFTSAMDPRSPNKTIVQKNLVHAAPGDPFIRIPIRYLAADFKNHRADFFEQFAAQSKRRPDFVNDESEWVAEKLQFIPTPFGEEYSHTKPEVKFEKPSAAIRRKVSP